MIKLSIIVPFYNVEPFIEECIRSLYNQDISWEEYEVICVDDCSPDGSHAIVEQLQKEYPTLRLICHRENKKLGGARNTGLKVAQGKYIWFVDSDDFIEKNVLSYLLNVAEHQKLDVLHFDYVNYPFVSAMDRSMPETPVMSGIELLFSPTFEFDKDLITAWQKIYNRQFLIDNNLFFAENIMFEDNDFAIAVLAYSQRVKHINLNAYFYRNNANSITRVKQTVEHINYYFAVVYLLHDLQVRFVKEEKDLRLINLVINFNRSNIYDILNVYMHADKRDQKEMRKIIKRKVKKTLKSYMPKLLYYKIILGLF